MVASVRRTIKSSVPCRICDRESVPRSPLVIRDPGRMLVLDGCHSFAVFTWLSSGDGLIAGVRWRVICNMLSDAGLNTEPGNPAARRLNGAATAQFLHNCSMGSVLPFLARS